MPQSNSLEARLYDHTHKLLRAHEVLLSDSVRNQAFYKALQKCVKAGSVVLDIGAGTGIWAIAAAKLGAKKVVAIEMDELLIGLIKTLAKEQGVFEKIEAVCGSSFDVRLEREFDVVISETIGYLGFDENIVPVMLDARRRFLKKDGLLIPETVSLFAAAAQLRTEKEIVPCGLAFDFKQLAKLNLNSPRLLSKKSDLRLVTKPQRLIQINFYKIDEQEEKQQLSSSLENLRVTWEVSDAAQINCFIVWAESRLTQGVKLSTRRTSSWQPNIYRIKPLEAKEGVFNQVKFELSLTAVSNYWTATFSNGQTRKIQRYSPEFAATELTLNSRTDDLSLIEQLQQASSSTNSKYQFAQ